MINLKIKNLSETFSRKSWWSASSFLSLGIRKSKQKVMTKQEITNKIATLEAQITKARQDRFIVEKAVDAEIREVLTAHLKSYNVFIHGFELLEQSGGTYWQIGRIREGYNYAKDELTLNFSEDWDRGKVLKTVLCKNITTSFYSTSENSTYELQRMVMIGKVGEMLLNKKEVILEQVNDIKKKYGVALYEASSNIYGKEKELGEFTRQLNEYEKMERFNKVVEEGIEVKEDYKNRIFKIGRHELWGVEKLKAIPVGTGRFCKLQIYHTNSGTYEYHTKVKTEALADALTYYRERIVS
jgi:hypothetical protein